MPRQDKVKFRMSLIVMIESYISFFNLFHLRE